MDLPPKPFEVLRHLVVHAGRLVSKQELFEAVWPNVAVSDDSLIQCIRELRRKLGDNEHRLIKTVPRRGYLLDVTVSQRAQFTSDPVGIRQPERSRLDVAISGGTAGARVWRRVPFGQFKLSAHAVSSTLYVSVKRLLRRLAAKPLSRTLAIVVAFAVVLAALALEGDIRSKLATSAAPIPNRSVDSKIPLRSFQITIAVLPFTVLTEDHAPSAAVAERLSDELRSYLSRTSFLRVLSRDAVLHMNSSGQSIGRQSHAAPHYILRGAALITSNKLQLTLDLIDVTTQVQVWSKLFEHTLAEWPARQGDIAKQLAYAVHVETIRREAIGLPDRTSELSDAQLLGSGWAVMMGWGRLRLKHAELVFSEALRRDPGSTSAMMGLAGAKLLAASNLIGERLQHMAEAEALLGQALVGAETNFITYFYLGVLHNLQSNLSAALQAYDRALDMNPSFAPAYAYKGCVLIRMGMYKEALESIEYAYAVAGKVVSGWQVWQGIAQLQLGQDKQAGDSLHRALAALPENPYVHAALASYYALTNERQNALLYVGKLRKRTPEMSDHWRLVEFNKGANDQPLPGRLGDGLRRALEAEPQSQ